MPWWCFEEQYKQRRGWTAWNEGSCWDNSGRCDCMTLWQWDPTFEWENDKNSSLVMENKEEGWVKEDERFLGEQMRVQT